MKMSVWEKGEEIIVLSRQCVQTYQEVLLVLVMVGMMVMVLFVIV